MLTLRVKLTIHSDDTTHPARATFDELSEVHEAQAVFQVNETEYIDRDDWGFKITYRSQESFVQSTDLREIERVMADVAPNTFEEKLGY